MHPIVEEVTERIRQRSRDSRQQYLAHIDQLAQAGPSRASLSCSNLAHGMAACQQTDKQKLTDELVPNIAIVTAYNDMLSAHQPYQGYPEIIKQAATEAGAVAQVAGGVPAMCDGVTQGQPGMELSLFSRDVIALATSVALTHNMFDAALMLGICDKIVPGLMIGALTFGHLPVIFVPAGPMPSGLPNKEKARVREAYAAGEANRSELIAAESASYHSPGTCTFYGTANSNQMLMEIMGLQLPGSSFINPDDPKRDPFTREAVFQVLTLEFSRNYTPIGKIVDERAIVNAVAGLLATGGSTNHTMHLVAIAAAAGIKINWSDMADLSRAVPLLAQVYPNGTADVNQFHDAGGLAVVIAELLDAGLLHEDVQTVMGPGLSRYTHMPSLEIQRPAPSSCDIGYDSPGSITQAARDDFASATQSKIKVADDSKSSTQAARDDSASPDSPPIDKNGSDHANQENESAVDDSASPDSLAAEGRIGYLPIRPTSSDLTVVRSVSEPFQAEGGIQLLQGNLGRAVVKVSAVDPAHRSITAPARVFRSQDEFVQRFEAGEFKSSMVAVVTGQGPRANGMPELHRLSPYLGTLQNQGYQVALLTDGRMSGASGKVLAAIQVTPEAAQGGAIGKIADGDMITIDAEAGLLEAKLDGQAAANATGTIPATDTQEPGNNQSADDTLKPESSSQPDGPQQVESSSQSKGPRGDDSLHQYPGGLPTNTFGYGRELFMLFRQQVGSAEAGASIFSPLPSATESTPASQPATMSSLENA